MTLTDKIMDGIAIIKEARKLPLPKRVISWENTIAEVGVQTVTGVWAGVMYGFLQAALQVTRMPVDTARRRLLRRFIIGLTRHPAYYRERMAKSAYQFGTVAATFSVVDAVCRHCRQTADPLNRGIAGFVALMPRTGIPYALAGGAIAYALDDAMERANIRVFQLPGELQRDEVKQLLQTAREMQDLEVEEEVARRRIERQERILAGLPVERIVEKVKHPRWDALMDKFEHLLHHVRNFASGSNQPYISRADRRELASYEALAKEIEYVKSMYAKEQTEKERKQQTGGESGSNS